MTTAFQQRIHEIAQNAIERRHPDRDPRLEGWLLTVYHTGESNDSRLESDAYYRGLIYYKHEVRRGAAESERTIRLTLRGRQLLRAGGLL